MPSQPAHQPPVPDQPITLVRHRPGAPGLRLGLGPDFRPVDGIGQLQRLFDQHSFWARGRRRSDLRRVLRQSQAVVSLWQGSQLVGFGRATSDTAYRAVLWDVVVMESFKGQGLGRRLVEALLEAPGLRRVEKVYLMTTESRGFYERLGFEAITSQYLMIAPLKTATDE
ncbi:MAG: GNAT family N-acetyltransferase [Cyanobacteriota bacterium]|jgi:ribosomal protein S18 acetylase RimI-like enzyme